MPNYIYTCKTLIKFWLLLDSCYLTRILFVIQYVHQFEKHQYLRTYIYVQLHRLLVTFKLPLAHLTLPVIVKPVPPLAGT